MSNYHRKIVFDFDDTISFTKNRDWDNAQPNIKLIEKINELYDCGWVIDIYTARGSISCSTRKEASNKYRSSIEQWLNKHNVKYNSLSFDKPLATYYVDDKAMTPEQFIDSNIYNLEGGLSGSDIYTDGSSVYKKDKNAHNVHAWYNEANKFLNVPSVRTVIGDVITMDYVEHDENFFTSNYYIALGLIQESLDTMKSMEITSKYDFKTYADRIYNHCELANCKLFDDVTQELSTLNLKQSFSHGDYGIKNMLFDSCNKQMYLIDPIPNMFGCTELDTAKFIASLYINKYEQNLIEQSINALCVFNNIDVDCLKLLVCCEIIRVYKYHPDKNFIIECVRNVFE